MELMEIYSKISDRQVQTLMFHKESSNMFDFMSMRGYKRWHETIAFKEFAEMFGVDRYAINHQNKLIPSMETKSPRIIPSEWFRATRYDVTESTRKQYTLNNFDTWSKWEKETKSMLSEFYRDLTAMNMVADACKVKELLDTSDYTLKCVEREILSLKSNYEEMKGCYYQEVTHDKYADELKEIGVYIC